MAFIIVLRENNPDGDPAYCGPIIGFSILSPNTWFFETREEAVDYVSDHWPGDGTVEVCPAPLGIDVVGVKSN